MKNASRLLKAIVEYGGRLFIVYIRSRKSEADIRGKIKDAAAGLKNKPPHIALPYRGRKIRGGYIGAVYRSTYTEVHQAPTQQSHRADTHSTGGRAERTHTAQGAEQRGQVQKQRATAHTGKHTTHREKDYTQLYIVMCYDDSVEHKGSDQTVTPNHSTCSPQRGHTKA